MKTTNAMGDCAALILEGSRCVGYDVCGPTMGRLYVEGYLKNEGSGPVLTAAGEALARAYIAKRDAQRAKRNRAARGRNAAMRSLGLVKTPYGWE